MNIHSKMWLLESKIGYSPDEIFQTYGMCSLGRNVIYWPTILRINLWER